MSSFNPLVEKLSPPPVPAVAAWGRAYRGTHGPLIDLSQAVPGYPAHPEMLRLLGETGSSTGFTGYGAIEGELSLRQAYAAHLSQVYAAELRADNIHITSGCNQAFVCAAMTVAGAGDTVLMTEPFYFNHETTLAMMGIRTAFVPCQAERGFLPDLAAIDAAITPQVRALALVSPNNPTGAIYPPDLLRAIFDLCREKGIWLILDETYRDFMPDAGRAPHELFSMAGWEETLISLYSFSKSFCIPGHRLGAITAGAATVEQIAKIMDNLQICAPRAAQAAVAQALPLLADWREANRQEIGRRAEALKTVMRSVNDWTLDAIGAYFAFVRHPFAGHSSVEVAEKLAKEAGIVCIPGVYFGERQQDYLRFAFANADAPTIALLQERLKNFSLS
ncbi:aspartate/tyrosine/aromatic aminotransferase [Neorhizobium sp. SOG26]|uniref:aminotransferase n=1 Tax=Neorhizobium sp. SOG26 TaxID=2060726 RepID=UPI000E590A3F|nr:aminotransferase [Neorhizobium sp. SOG26]AXV16377.1 aspartate/tyrosine/aromatic aminotransferase [Neorhizobium sp. SOG26]